MIKTLDHTLQQAINSNNKITESASGTPNPQQVAETIKRETGISVVAKLDEKTLDINVKRVLIG